MTLEPNTERFYSGKYLVDFNPEIDGEAYELPLQEASSTGLVDNYSHLKETSNVEDLLVGPEDFHLLAEEAQAGCEEWGEVILGATSGEFEGSPISNFAFYNFYLGPCGRGRNQQATPIAISDFYYVAIESGSVGREILEFC